MSSELDGKHYDRNRRDYVLDEVAEVVNPFTLIEPPHKVDVATLPTSPKRVYNSALANGWDARAWLSIGTIAPVLYVNDSDSADESASEHAAGDVKFDGYLAHIYTVEAADRSGKLGFRAQFSGRAYADARKAALGGFDYAQVSDPAGVPVPLEFEYLPIKLKRGTDNQGRTVETTSGFASRQRAAEASATRLNREMNDGAIRWATRHFYSTAAEFNAWLVEWASFTSNRKAS